MVVHRILLKIKLQWYVNNKSLRCKFYKYFDDKEKKYEVLGGMDCPKGLKVTKRKDCKAACCALGIPFGIRSEDFKHSRQCYSLDKTCTQKRSKKSEAICKIGIQTYINVAKFVSYP